jgi:hypothetical protein
MEIADPGVSCSPNSGPDRLRLVKPWLVSITLLASGLMPGCAKEKAEEAVVNVQVATVEKKTLQRTVEADAILFPLQQSAIVPKITAPVKKF